ncbi:MAG: nidogen-like domain-containing protein [Nitrososphaerales archaeon]
MTDAIPSEVEGGASGLMTYGTTIFEGHEAFCVDWPYVGYYDKHTDRLNDFQLMILDRSDVGPGAFEIVFNYDQVRWETGDASGGHDGLGGESAAVGFSNGDGTPGHSLELPGSHENGPLLDSNSTTGLIHHDRGSTVLGRYVFDVFPH